MEFDGGYTVDFEDGDGAAPFSNRPSVRVSRGVVAYTAGLEYEILLATPDLDLFRIVRWSGRREPLLPPEVDAVRDSFAKMFEPSRAAQPELVQHFMDGTFSDRVTPEMRPALGRILLDELGQIWVSRFAPRTDDWDEPDAWEVLSPQGVPIARLVLPVQVRLAAVRSDRIALIGRDDLDVPHVFVYRVGEGLRAAGQH